MKVDSLFVIVDTFTSTSISFYKLLCPSHAYMKDALTLLVIVVSNYMLALAPFVQLSGEAVHLSEPIVIRAARSRKAAAIEL